MASSGLNTKLVASRSEVDQGVKYVQKIYNKILWKRNRNSKNITVNKDMFIVHQETLEKSLKYILQAVDKEA